MMKKNMRLPFLHEFPDYYREFTWNGLSLRVDRSGGFENLKIDRIEKHIPFVIPDVEMLQLFGRSGNKSLIHPLYGPAIGFYTENAQGRVIPHHPQRVRIRPEGFDSIQNEDGFSARYDLFITDLALYADFQVRDTSARQFTAAISKLHFNTGKFTSSFNPIINDASAKISESLLKFMDIAWKLKYNPLSGLVFC